MIEETLDTDASIPADTQEQMSAEEYEALSGSARPDGPAYPEHYFLKLHNGALYTLRGRYDYNDVSTKNPGNVQKYDGTDWTVLDTTLLSGVGRNYLNNIQMDIDPRNSQHLMVASQTGLYEYLNGALVKYYDSPAGGAVMSVAYDSKGNLYFCDHRLRRVWQWSPEKGLKLLADFPWKPCNIAVDTQDNVLVTFRYDRQPGFDADPADVSNLPDSYGTSFSGWGNSGFATLAYAIDPEDPENSIRLLDLVPMGSVANVAKALYPSNRWRDFHDFWTNVVFRPEKCFVAPDGRTIIPQQYDLVRSTSLIEAVPGGRVFLSDDYDRRVVSAAVAADGSLSDPKIFVERGEFGVATDAAGNVYVADGEVLVYGPDGSYKRTIRVPERPASLTVVGSKLYITARSGVYVHEI